LIGFFALVLPIVLAIAITIALARLASVLGASGSRYANILKLLVLDGAVLLAVGFLVSLFIFNPTHFFIGRTLTFQDHFSYAMWNAGIMALLVVPGTLLAFKAAVDASRSSQRNET